MVVKRYLHAVLTFEHDSDGKIWTLRSAGGSRVLDKCENHQELAVLDFLSIEEGWEFVTIYKDRVYLRKEY